MLAEQDAAVLVKSHAFAAQEQLHNARLAKLSPARESSKPIDHAMARQMGLFGSP